MRAAVVERYGPPEVVRIREVPDPEPRRGQVLIRVHAAAVTSGDARIRAARFPPGFAPLARLALGLRRPRRPVLGSAYCGVVERCAAGVDGVQVGDRVCGMAGARMGAHAELLVRDAADVVAVPDGVGDEDAAGLLFGATTAWHYLVRKGGLGPRDDASPAGTAGRASVLVNGASGAVGTNAVQLARHLGAQVTAVTSAANEDLARSLGADRVIDHTEVDVTTIGQRYDVVLDAVGNLSIRSGRRLLTPRGRLLLVVASLGETIRARGDTAAGPAPERVDDMARLLALVAEGELRVVIDRSVTLSEIVDAHRRVDTGHKVGNVLVRP